MHVKAVVNWTDVALVLTEFTTGGEIEKQNYAVKCGECHGRGNHGLLGEYTGEISHLNLGVREVF